MKIVLGIVVVVFYFLVSWLVPWPVDAFPTYLIFDLVFSMAVLILMKEKLAFCLSYSQKTLISTVLLAASALILLKICGWQTPFVHISNFEIKLVLAAPIIEELLFRGAFHSILRKSLKRHFLLILSSFLFSLSHFYSAFTAPKEFHSFIFLQTGYTFILGYILAKDFEENMNLARVIILHFIFNAIFLIGIKTQFIN